MTEKRPKRSLFSFTRKRVFDMLSARFTGFSIQGIGNDSQNGSTITFAYFGNARIRITEQKDKTVVIEDWYTFAKEKTNLSITSERSKVNTRLENILKSFAPVKMGGSND